MSSRSSGGDEAERAGLGSLPEPLALVGIRLLHQTAFIISDEMDR